MHLRSFIRACLEAPLCGDLSGDRPRCHAERGAGGLWFVVVFFCAQATIEIVTVSTGCWSTSRSRGKETGAHSASGSFAGENRFPHRAVAWALPRLFGANGRFSPVSQDPGPTPAAAAAADPPGVAHCRCQCGCPTVPPTALRDPRVHHRIVSSQRRVPPSPGSQKATQSPEGDAGYFFLVLPLLCVCTCIILLVNQHGIVPTLVA